MNRTYHLSVPIERAPSAAAGSLYGGDLLYRGALVTTKKELVT